MVNNNNKKEKKKSLPHYFKTFLLFIVTFWVFVGAQALNDADNSFHRTFTDAFGDWLWSSAVEALFFLLLIITILHALQPLIDRYMDGK